MRNKKSLALSLFIVILILAAGLAATAQKPEVKKLPLPVLDSKPQAGRF